MENQGSMNQRIAGIIGSGGFATKQIIIGISLLVIIILAGGLILGVYPKLQGSGNEEGNQTVPVNVSHDASQKSAVSPGTAAKESHSDSLAAAVKTVADKGKQEDKDLSIEVPVGVAFVEATIGPLRHELSERFWGWRPNDVFSFATDNVNNFQLGVIEVTRRTVEKLTDNISRTGAASSFDKNLENARSTCFVIEAESFMFPSSEGRYNDGLEELEKYAEKLKKGEAKFFTRADNLIPLLREFENLLGSCDDNLVKMREEDGSKVSFFQADNYFFYAKGVASAMIPILDAVEKDFYPTIERRNCLKELEHAIESLGHATHISPTVILDSDLSSIFANHRANMAAHISHARFYIDVLIKTLST